jgi:hypothetical protein
LFAGYLESPGLLGAIRDTLLDSPAAWATPSSAVAAQPISESAAESIRPAATGG